MAAYYAEISRVGKLEAGFHQIHLVQIVWYFHSIVMKDNSLKITKEKLKNIFLDKNSKISLYYRTYKGQLTFCSTFNFRVNIWEQNTETVKKKWFLRRYSQSEQNILFKIKCQAKSIFPRDVKRTVALLHQDNYNRSFYKYIWWRNKINTVANWQFFMMIYFHNSSDYIRPSSECKYIQYTRSPWATIRSPAYLQMPCNSLPATGTQIWPYHKTV